MGYPIQSSAEIPWFTNIKKAVFISDILPVLHSTVASYQ